MALRAVPEHPKFFELKAILKIPKFQALGILEGIWHFTGKFAPQGNIGKFNDRAIESWVEWDGEAGTLIAALVESGWLDSSEEHRLVVHDWRDHADQTTRKQLGRTKKAFVQDMSGQDRDVSGQDGIVSRPPEPVPVPEPVPIKNSSRAKKPHEGPTKTEFVQSRHDAFKQALLDYWTSKNPGVEMPWDGSEGKQLGIWLRASPNTTVEQFVGFLRHRFRSDVNHAERPSRWIGNVTSFAASPLDQYGKPKSVAKQAQPVPNGLDAIRERNAAALAEVERA